MKVKSYDGQDIDVKTFRECLNEFPSYSRKSMTQDGEPYLSNIVERFPECGCRIKGNGTIQFPLMIEFCEEHK